MPPGYQTRAAIILLLLLVFIDTFNKCVVDFGIYFFLNAVTHSGTFINDGFIGFLIDFKYLSTAVFDGLDSVSDSVIGCLTCIFRCCCCSFFQYALILFRHALEELVVHDQCDQVRQMICLYHVILLLNDILERGDADFIGIGRGLIADPDWVNKVEFGDVCDIRKCISCNIGCAGNRIQNNRPIRCTVNPAVIEGEEYKKLKVNKPCNVVVIGGGTAGMEAACTAAEVGCTAFLIEKADHLGGLAYEISKFPDKSRLRDFPDYLERRIKKLHNVHVFLNTEATPEFIRSLNPDIIVNSTGSLPLILPIPGLKENVGKGKVQTVLGVIDNLDNYPEDCTGKKVVVIGAGAVGLDVVEFFAPRGADTTVIEMLPYIVGPALDPITKVSIVDLMNKYNVHQRPSTALQEVKPDCFVVKNPDGSMEEVEFDYGCICMGLKSNNPVLDMLKEEFADVELMNIGDSKRQRRIIEGTEEARAIVKVLEKKGFFC